MNYIKQQISSGKITLICDRCGIKKDIDTNNVSRTLIDVALKSFGEDHKHQGREK